MTGGGKRAGMQILIDDLMSRKRREDRRRAVAAFLAAIVIPIVYRAVQGHRWDVAIPAGMAIGCAAWLYVDAYRAWRRESWDLIVAQVNVAPVADSQKASEGAS